MKTEKLMAFGIAALGVAVGVAVGMSLYHGVLKHFVDTKLHVKTTAHGTPVADAHVPVAPAASAAV